MRPSRDNLQVEQFFGGAMALDRASVARLSLKEYDEEHEAPTARYEDTGLKVTVGPKVKVRVNQPTVTHDGVDRQMNSGNRKVMLTETDDGLVALDGHHRLVAARLQGQDVDGEIWAPTNNSSPTAWPY